MLPARLISSNNPLPYLVLSLYSLPFTHCHGGSLTTKSAMPTDAIECPLCLGAGKLKRTEVLDRLGVKDFARVAQLSAEEAIRLLLSKHQQDEQSGWARFEAELAKRTAANYAEPPG